jgi:hypothetical protein
MLADVAGRSFSGASLTEILIDTTNRFLSVRDNCVFDVGSRSLKVYFGRDLEVTVGKDVGRLCAECFAI